MYAISNQQRDEIVNLLAALQDLPGKDTKTINIKRKTSIMIKKLNKSKKFNKEIILTLKHK